MGKREREYYLAISGNKQTTLKKFVKVKGHTKTSKKHKFIPIVFDKKDKKEKELYFNSKPVVFSLVSKKQVVPVTIRWLQKKGVANRFIVKKGIRLD